MNLKDLESAVRNHLGGDVPKGYAKSWNAAFNDKISDHAQIQRLKDMATAIGNGKNGFTADPSLQRAILEHIRDNYAAKDNKTMMAQTLRDLKTLDKMGVKSASLETPAATPAPAAPPIEEKPPVAEDTPVAAPVAETMPTEEPSPAAVAETAPKEPAMAQGAAQNVLDSAAYMTGAEFQPEIGVYAHNGNPDALIHVREENGMAIAREIDLATEKVDPEVTAQTVLVASRVKDPVRALLGSHSEEAGIARATLKNNLYTPVEGFRLHDLIHADESKLSPSEIDARLNAAQALAPDIKAEIGIYQAVDGKNLHLYRDADTSTPRAISVTKINGDTLRQTMRVADELDLMSVAVPDYKPDADLGGLLSKEPSQDVKKISPVAPLAAPAPAP
jgi:hypothetical protein